MDGVCPYFWLLTVSYSLLDTDEAVSCEGEFVCEEASQFPK